MIPQIMLVYTVHYLLCTRFFFAFSKICFMAKRKVALTCATGLQCLGLFTSHNRWSENSESTGANCLTEIHFSIQSLCIQGSGNAGILPPPPGGSGVPKLAGPPSGAGSRPVAPANTNAPVFQPAEPANIPASNPPSDWGDFATASASSEQ